MSPPVPSDDAVENSNLNNRIEYLERSIAAAGGTWSGSPKRFWVVVTNSEGASIGKSGFGKLSL
jgi:hypothetical protein